MEQNPLTSSDETSKKKKTAKIARSMPIGLKLETNKPDVEQPERPRLSINERFMQQMQDQAERRQAEAAKAEAKEKDDDDEEDDDSDDSGKPKLKNAKVASEESEAKQESTHSIDAIIKESLDSDDEEKLTPDTNDTLEAANWTDEGEFSEAGEIPLTPPDKAEEVETFVDVPIETEETFSPDIEETVEPELLDMGLAPEITAEAEDEEPESTIVSHSRTTPSPVGSAWYDAAAADRAARERKHELEEESYLAEKRGLRHGLASGLLFGWLLGRHGKKKAAQEHAKETKQQNERIKELTNEQAAAKQRLEAIKRTQEQIQSNIQHEGVKLAGSPENKHKGQNEVASMQINEQKSPRSSGASRNEQYVDSKQHIKVSEIVTSAAAELVKMPESKSRLLGVEKPRQEPEFHDTSRPSEVLARRFEKAKAEIAPEDLPITEETYEVSNGRRVETSAWHRIEVDAKTGKAVQDPEVAYGEEFKREQRQEVKKEDTSNSPTAGGGGVSSSLSGLASAAVRQMVRRDPANPYPESEGSLLVSRKKSVEEHLTAGAELLRYASMPIIWATAIIIVLGLILLGILQ